MKPIKYMLNRPVVLSSCMFYLLFCLLFITDEVVEKLDIDFDLGLSLTAFLWPYPLLLSLQTWLSPNSLGSFVLADLAGLGLLLLWSSWLQRKFRGNNPSWPAAFYLSALTWFIPLILFQVVLHLVMSAMGFPTGE